MHCTTRKKLARYLFSFAGLSWAVSSGTLVFAQVSPVGITTGPIPPRASPVSQQPYFLQSPAPSYGNASMLNSIDALNDQTKLKAGDQLSYRVIEEQDPEPELLTVSPTGDVEVPLLGHFPAVGKTCRELATQLKPLLEKDYFYKATVIVAINALSTAPIGKVYLTGQVKEQGAIDIPPNEVFTVSKAILLDGGLADFADRNRIRLLHHNADGTTKTTVVSMKKVLDQGHSNLDPVVQDGDTINVPQRLINW
jgi:polysaccharide export outer membrane protein